MNIDIDAQHSSENANADWNATLQDESINNDHKDDDVMQIDVDSELVGDVTEILNRNEGNTAGETGESDDTHTKVKIENPPLAENAESGDDSPEVIIANPALAGKGHYLMEFRVIIDDGFVLPKNADLMIFFPRLDLHYVMRFNARIQAYQTMLQFHRDKFNHIYKYYVQFRDAGSEYIWEKNAMCTDSAWNRKCCISKEQQEYGHAVVFDVVFFEDQNEEKYSELFHENVVKIIPFLDVKLAHIPTSNSNKDIIELVRLFEQWVESYFTMKEFVDHSNSPRRETGPDCDQNVLTDRLLILQAGNNDASFVFGMLCLFLAIRKKNLLGKLKSTFCFGMSLDGLDDEQFLLFLNLFDALKNYHETSTKLPRLITFEYLLNSFMKPLMDVTEFLFIFPILRLTQGGNPGEPIEDPSATLIYWESFKDRFKKSSLDQKRTMLCGQLPQVGSDARVDIVCAKLIDLTRCLLDLRERVFIYAQRFPWLKNLYIESMTLDSVLKLMRMCGVGKFGADLLLPKIHSFWKQLNAFKISEDLTDEVLAGLCNYVNEDLQNMQQLSNANINFDQGIILPSLLNTCAKIIKEMKLQSSDCNSGRHKFYNRTFRVCDEIFKCAHMAAAKCRDEAHIFSARVKRLQDDLMEIEASMLERESPKKPLNVAMWNCLSEQKWYDQDFHDRWVKAVTGAIKSASLCKFKDAKKIVEYYCDKWDNEKPTELVSEWFTEVVIQEFVNFVVSQKQKNAFSLRVTQMLDSLAKKTDQDIFRSKVALLCTSVLRKQLRACPNYEWNNSEIFLDFVQNWDTSFLKVIYEKKLIEHLPSDIKKNIDSIEESMYTAVRDLESAQISVTSFENMQRNREVFYDCFLSIQRLRELQPKQKDLSVAKSFSRDHFNDLINLRAEELTEFWETREGLENMIKYFQHVTNGKLNFNCKNLQQQLAQNIASYPLGVLTKCRQLKSENRKHIDHTLVIYFQLPPEDMLIVSELQKNNVMLHQSTVFDKQVHNAVETARLDGHENMSMHEAIQDLWKPCRNKLTKILQGLDDKKINLGTLDDTFCGMEESSFDESKLQEELNHLYSIAGIEMSNRDIHVQQLKSYFKLKHNLEGAAYLDAIRDLLHLSGSFNDLTRLLNRVKVARSCNLSNLNTLIQHVNKVLQMPSDNMYSVQTLKKFVESQELVFWLKEHIKNSKEVKSLIDIALVAAGEDTMEIDRVSCFNSALLGFSPLIFNLNSKSGLKQLLEACQEVWTNVNSDPSILDKWEEASKQIGWLEYMQSFAGSTEKSSLDRANLINTKGTYIIKCDADLIPTTENSLTLVLIDRGTEIKMKLKDLRDLQSRLMLFAVNEKKRNEQKDKETKERVETKGKKTVKRFMNVLSCVENLAKTYVKLKRFGCSLFVDWSARIRCAEEENGSSAAVEVYFIEDNRCQPISSSDNIIDEMMNLADILDATYCRWMDYLMMNRNKHYQLNYFDIQQLTFLCKELASSSDYKDQVYQLLACVSSDVDKDMIVECLEEASENEDQNADESGPDTDAKKLHPNQPNFETVHSILNDRSCMTLKQVITQLQSDVNSDTATMTTIVETICERYFKRSAETTLEDCLSLDHCGKFLACLRSRADPASFPHREWSDHFTAGKPNLLICRQPKNVLLALLSLYMHSPSQALPSASEVLLCSENTSAEDVELLFRRAIQKQAHADQRIYCLACADLLSFDVAKKAEEYYDSLMQLDNRNVDFKLIILTSSYQHYLSSCFDEHKIEGYSIKKKRALKAHIQQHLSRRNVSVAAAAINEDSSSVMVVRSKASGMGKSLYISRCHEAVLTTTHTCNSSTIRLLEKEVDVDAMIANLINAEESISNSDPHFVHIDITPSVQAGISKTLFELVILGMIKSSRGVIWRHAPSHLYMMEYTEAWKQVDVIFSKFLNLLPSVTCLSPAEVKNYLQQNREGPKPGDEIHMDILLLKDEMYQRPFQYLRLYSANENLNKFRYSTPDEDPLECLSTLLQHCGVEAPSWSELSHFSKFLNVQLRDCESSDFCNVEAVGADSGFDGFKQFVVRFMVTMSKDFAIPSLNNEERYCDQQQPDSPDPPQTPETDLHPYLNYSRDIFNRIVAFIKFINHMALLLYGKFFNTSDDDDDDDDDDDEQHRNQNVNLLEMHQLQRRWENGFHPYVFFNADRHSMSFANFNVNKQGTLCHPKTKEEIENNLMHPNLVAALTRNRVDLQQDIDKMSREEKLTILCQVFGIETVLDPDPTYELTTDNVLKMLAIHMRLRCGIPVVVMGETGCGKTRMIDFMSKLKAEGKENAENMVVVKVHGGITAAMVQEKVEKAIDLAKRNQAQHIRETMLFFDEANTTEAIYAIKEIMCDETVRGKTFADSGLRIVAACNPYRTHSPEAIKAMEGSGLGFHVKHEDVSDTFDDTPMRHLVYRVISLPTSMHPLVWDFGQLNDETEGVYIKQMVLKLKTDISSESNELELSENDLQTITRVVTASQAYMRGQHGVCSFVSLRDAERVIESFKWFYEHAELINPLLEAQKETDQSQRDVHIRNCVRSLIQSLSMCYYVKLDERSEYREMLAEEISSCEQCRISGQDILQEIVACQNAFVNAIELEKNIARNEALRENVFMIVMCAEMRIPLFLVGKPGSSKSLAKTLVTDAMQGKSSKNDLYRHLKEIHVISFQCSPATDAVGIEAVFTQCAQLQKNKDCSKYVATVVLDEIGLAEDSRKMPLKVLHPLLEASSTSNSLTVDAHQKVGFVGISNWALDPAKMNRGIFVTRGKPSPDDLHKTAEAIFESDQEILQNASKCIKAVTDAYLEVYEDQRREFFGLRDYYAMMKMLHVSSSSSSTRERKDLTFDEIGRAIIRNFSGGTSAGVLSCFQRHCRNIFENVQLPCISVIELIQNNLDPNLENRFLLLLTKQYTAINLLPEVLGNRDYVVIFGSSFPHDHDYTEVCRNISKIKGCMENGRTVVLLNLRDLYESLYDALNQHYVTLAGQRYVDLGLGGHRVKCRIASNFRLVVIEEKEIVYLEYPIPLINRLEKHVFETANVLSVHETTIVKRLKNWVTDCCKVKSTGIYQNEFVETDLFVGHNEDSCASALLSVDDRSFEAAQRVLLQTASLDGVCRLPKSDTEDNVEILLETYMDRQIHDSLWIFLQEEVKKDIISIYEILSFSQVLNERDKQKIQNLLQLPAKNLMLLNLLQFQSEQQFSEKIADFLKLVGAKCCNATDDKGSCFILFIQCPQAYLNRSLIACAKYAVIDMARRLKLEMSEFTGSLTISFLLTLERHAAVANTSLSYANFYSRDCSSVYIDELKPYCKPIAPVSKLRNLTIYDIVESDSVLVDIEMLLRESIPIAMAKLQNRVEDASRNRIQLLQHICFENPDLQPFFDILVKRVKLLVKSRENKFPDEDEWLIEQACSASALQEGGTFRNVIWLRLKFVFAVALAKLISVADVDNNLDLLKHCIGISPNLANLWFEMFDDDDIWNFQWPNMSIDSQVGTVYVDGKMGFSCSFPFVRLCCEELMKEWYLVLESNVSDQRKDFLQKISLSPFQRHLDAAEEIGMAAINRFVFDLLHLLYKPQNLSINLVAEIEVVKSYLLLLRKIRRNRPGCQRNNELLEMFILLIENTKDMQTFAEVFRVLPDIASERESWISEENDSEIFCLHHMAFGSLIKQMEAKFEKSLESVDAMQQWKSLVIKTKQISEKLLPHAEVTIQNIWQRILFIEMFLDEVLTATASPNFINMYLKHLSVHAYSLWSNAVDILDLSSLTFLKIVVKTLKLCVEELRLLLLCNWQDINCNACERNMLNEPVMLSCKHYLCKVCGLQRSTCPLCEKDIEQPNNLSPMELTSLQQKELKTFKFACTRFFLEYLSNICVPSFFGSLRNNIPPGEEVAEIFLALEELVISDDKTKVISPVLADLDLNLTARSYILQLLLRCDGKLVEKQLERHLRRMGEVLNDRSVLMELFIKCKQDILLHQLFNSNELSNDLAKVTFCHDLLQQSVNSIRTAHSFNQIDHLRMSALLQFVAKTAASSIQTTTKVDIEGPLHIISNFINALERLSAGPEFLIFRQFIIKCLCRRYGTDAFNIMLENDLLKKLVPKNLISESGQQQEKYFVADKFSLSGRTYVETKASLLDIADEEDVYSALQHICGGSNPSRDEWIQILLAVSTWTAHDGRNDSRQRIFKTVRQRLPRALNFPIFHDIANGRIESLKCSMSNRQFELYELLIHFGVTVLTSQDYLLRSFWPIFKNPNSTHSLFLPTMPDANYSAVQNAVKDLEVYSCPNGHPYYIADCGKPWVTTSCKECGSTIGGTLHKLAEGNLAGVAPEQSFAGYKTLNLDVPVISERNLTKLSVCATRVCLHLAMIFGSFEHSKDVAEILHRQPGQEVEFLYKLIQKDLQVLSDCIGHSVEDVFILMHLIFNKMRLSQSPQQQNCGWNSMKDRKEWENVFQRFFLSPIFSNSFDSVNQAHDTLIKAGKSTEKPLDRLVYELKTDDPLPDGIVPWNCPNLWKYMLHIDIHHIRQHLEGVVATSEAEGSALKIIFNYESLELIHHLHNVVTVQCACIKRYKCVQKIDMADAEAITIEEFLEKEDFIYKDEVDAYTELWNKVKNHPLNAGRYNASLPYLDDEMSRDSSISMCLPCSKGGGLCALVLAEYLIEQQNNLILKCRDLMEPKPSITTIDVGDLEASDLINISFREDLMPLVLENSQYETIVTDHGLQHNITYNLGLLQKKIMQKFFFAKPIINRETIPVMKYHQGIGLANHFRAVQNQHNQVNLPSKLCQDVDDVAEKALTAKVCEAVRTLGLLLQFLAKNTVNPERRVLDYAEKELLLPREEIEMIPHSAEICHCLALYERLSWHRSKRLIQTGRNPFENIENAEDIPDSPMLDTLKKRLSKMDVNQLQLELNSLLMVGPVIDNIEWGLVDDVLLPYLEMKHEEEDNSWCERLPKEIQYKHAVHVFLLSMEVSK